MLNSIIQGLHNFSMGRSTYKDAPAVEHHIHNTGKFSFGEKEPVAYNETKKHHFKGKIQPIWPQPSEMPFPSYTMEDHHNPPQPVMNYNDPVAQNFAAMSLPLYFNESPSQPNTVMMHPEISPAISHVRNQATSQMPPTWQQESEKSQPTPQPDMNYCDSISHPQSYNINAEYDLLRMNYNQITPPVHLNIHPSQKDNSDIMIQADVSPMPPNYVRNLPSCEMPPTWQQEFEKSQPTPQPVMNYCESGQLRINYNQQPPPVHPSQKDNSDTMIQADVSPSPPNYVRNYPSCEMPPTWQQESEKSQPTPQPVMNYCESGQLRINYNQQPPPVHPSQKDNSDTMIQADVSPSPPNYVRNYPSCEMPPTWQQESEKSQPTPQPVMNYCESGQLRINYNQQPPPVHPSQKDNSDTMIQADVSPSPPNYVRNYPTCEQYQEAPLSQPQDYHEQITLRREEEMKRRKMASPTPNFKEPVKFNYKDKTAARIKALLPREKKIENKASCEVTCDDLQKRQRSQEDNIENLEQCTIKKGIKNPKMLKKEETYRITKSNNSTMISENIAPKQIISMGEEQNPEEMIYKRKKFKETNDSDVKKITDVIMVKKKIDKNCATFNDRHSADLFGKQPESQQEEQAEVSCKNKRKRKADSEISAIDSQSSEKYQSTSSSALSLKESSQVKRKNTNISKMKNFTTAKKSSLDLAFASPRNLSSPAHISEAGVSNCPSISIYSDISSDSTPEDTAAESVISPDKKLSGVENNYQLNMFKGNITKSKLNNLEKEINEKYFSKMKNITSQLNKHKKSDTQESISVQAESFINRKSPSHTTQFDFPSNCPSVNVTASCKMSASDSTASIPDESAMPILPTINISTSNTEIQLYKVSKSEEIFNKFSNNIDCSPELQQLDMLANKSEFSSDQHCQSYASKCDNEKYSYPDLLTANNDEGLNINDNPTTKLSNKSMLTDDIVADSLIFPCEKGKEEGLNYKRTKDKHLKHLSINNHLKLFESSPSSFTRINSAISKIKNPMKTETSTSLYPVTGNSMQKFDSEQQKQEKNILQHETIIQDKFINETFDSTCVINPSITAVTASNAKMPLNTVSSIVCDKNINLFANPSELHCSSILSDKFEHATSHSNELAVFGEKYSSPVLLTINSDKILNINSDLNAKSSNINMCRDDITAKSVKSMNEDVSSTEITSNISKFKELKKATSVTVILHDFQKMTDVNVVKENSTKFCENNSKKDVNKTDFSTGKNFAKESSVKKTKPQQKKYAAALTKNFTKEQTESSFVNRKSRKSDSTIFTDILPINIQTNVSSCTSVSDNTAGMSAEHKVILSNCQKLIDVNTFKENIGENCVKQPHKIKNTKDISLINIAKNLKVILEPISDKCCSSYGIQSSLSAGKDLKLQQRKQISASNKSSRKRTTDVKAHKVNSDFQSSEKCEKDPSNANASKKSPLIERKIKKSNSSFREHNNELKSFDQKPSFVSSNSTALKRNNYTRSRRFVSMDPVIGNSVKASDSLPVKHKNRSTSKSSIISINKVAKGAQHIPLETSQNNISDIKDSCKLFQTRQKGKKKSSKKKKNITNNIHINHKDTCSPNSMKDILLNDDATKRQLICSKCKFSCSNQQTYSKHHCEQILEAMKKCSVNLEVINSSEFEFPDRTITMPNPTEHETPDNTCWTRKTAMKAHMFKELHKACVRIGKKSFAKNAEKCKTVDDVMKNVVEPIAELDSENSLPEFSLNVTMPYENQKILSEAAQIYISKSGLDEYAKLYKITPVDSDDDSNPDSQVQKVVTQLRNYKCKCKEKKSYQKGEEKPCLPCLNAFMNECVLTDLIQNTEKTSQTNHSNLQQEINVQAAASVNFSSSSHTSYSSCLSNNSSVNILTDTSSNISISDNTASIPKASIPKEHTLPTISSAIDPVLNAENDNSECFTNSEDICNNKTLTKNQEMLDSAENEKKSDSAQSKTINRGDCTLIFLQRECTVHSAAAKMTVSSLLRNLQADGDSVVLQDELISLLAELKLLLELKTDNFLFERVLNIISKNELHFVDIDYESVHLYIHKFFDDNIDYCAYISNKTNDYACADCCKNFPPHHLINHIIEEHQEKNIYISLMN